MTFFRDRLQAGRLLAERLMSYAARDDVLVLGLPRGGVPVAAEVARVLGARLDVFVVRKLGVPGHSELAMGAVASGGVRVLNADVVDTLHIPKRVVDGVTFDERRELERIERVYRGSNPPINVRDRIAIVVDDGLATGSSMRAAAAALRAQRPARLVLAAPVAAAATVSDLAPHADEIAIVIEPEPFYAVGLWYEDFNQTSEAEVKRLLDQAATSAASTL
jgi:putative phosphoribosyl transferase